VMYGTYQTSERMNRKRQVIPTLFFIVCGAIQDSIAHILWVVLRQTYFPGFCKAQAYAGSKKK
jgi:hypothetical protein